jgi:predicted porin
MARRFYYCALVALAAGAARADDTATLNGITFYGTIDLGVTYESHGAPSSGYGNVGDLYLVQKQSNRSTVNLAQSGMGQSKVGLKGAEDLGGGWTGLFKLETPVNPLGGNTTDALKSLTTNNGVAQQSQNAGIDSSRGANIFSQAAYVGVSNSTYGTLTAGRQTTLQADAISAYDPLYNSYAFSLIGFSGTASGAGATEDSRWDNSVKYLLSYGPFRAGVNYGFAGSLGRNDTGYAADVGADFGGLSLDAVVTHKKDEANASALSAAQLLTVTGLGYSSGQSLAFTVHDDTTYTLAARYNLAANANLFAGYENIQSSNPSSPLPVGFNDMGYTGAIVNNSAFPRTRVLQYAWVGGRYFATPKIELDAAWYYVNQNAYGTGANAGCSGVQSGSCSGSENVFSAVADYHFTKKFDAYAGVANSQVVGGLASGYFHNNNVSPTVGLRYSF